METILKQVRDFADAAHGEQRRKYTPDRYIVHPERVMKLLREYDQPLPVLAAALLHDVVEDTPVTPDEIRSYLLTLMPEPDAEETVRLVIELTDVYVKESFPQWNRKKRKEMELERLMKTSPDSQTIKYADILDNCKEIVSHDRHFARIFLVECLGILRKLKNGHPELYERTYKVVNEELKLLKR